jgi:hypothetical protein
MKKSTRALIGLVVLEGALFAGMLWMVWQTRTGAWPAPDPAAAIGTITRTIGGVMGITAAVLLIAAFLHRRRGD